MRNLLRILILLIIVAAVVCSSMFLMDQNDVYEEKDNQQTILPNEDVQKPEQNVSESGEKLTIESGDVEVSGDLNESIESGEKIEIEEIETTTSGDFIESGEIIESGEVVSGDLAE